VGGAREGGGGLVTAAARDEQRKMIKYNHLVANLPIFHTAIGMTRALDGIAADGFGDAASPEGIATLTRLEQHESLPDRHINRFGDYVLGYVDAARAAAVHAAAPTDEASDN